MRRRRRWREERAGLSPAGLRIADGLRALALGPPALAMAGGVPLAIPGPRVVAGADPTDVGTLLARLFEAEGQSLVRLVRLFVDDRNAAEDLVQEGFIRLARSAHRIEDPSKAAAYLRSIVLNLARDHNRRGFVSRRHLPPAQRDEPSAHDVVELDEDRRQVIAALREIAPRQRDCLVMRYYLEMGVDDVAAALGLSRNSVKTHLRRGLRALEQQLEGTR